MNPPRVVSAEEWQAARDALLVKEKEATRARDALAAERRTLARVHASTLSHEAFLLSSIQAKIDVLANDVVVRTDANLVPIVLPTELVLADLS